jgi:thiamine-phosphate pyrophosphorylase
MATLMLSPPIIMAISDRRLLEKDDQKAGDRLVAWASVVARAGVDLIQIRERGLDDRRLVALVREVCDAVRGSEARVVVNERTDIALAAGAAGVHLPGSAPQPSRVRAIVPRGFLVGRSVHSEEEAVLAERDGGCDYLVFGTVFPSSSKPAGHPVAGVNALRAIAERVRLPVVAVGGVDAVRATEVAKAGAGGIAAIGLFATPMAGAVEGGSADAVQFGLDRIVQALRRAFERPSRAAASR